MTARLLAAVLGLLVLVALLARGTGRGAAWAPFPPGPPAPRAAPPRPTLPRPVATPWEPSRNLFQYADGPAVAAPLPPPASMPRGPRGAIPAPVATATPSAVRVVGLIRRGGQLKAALMVQGEMALAGKGERAGGYTVLEVDEETGVRVRGPEGEETVLPPPRF